MNWKLKQIAVVLLIVMVCLSCHRQEHAPHHLIILVDISASIEPDAQKEVLKGIQGLAARLERGDCMTIIPINGDATTESSGRILRLERPALREVFDADQKRFQDQAAQSLETFATEQLRHPGARTDILGALRVAAEEARSEPRQTTIIVLSDFIEDDGELNFNTDERLASTTRAESLAQSMVVKNHSRFLGAQVVLGLLRSKDLGGLSRSRREAIEAFWLRFCSRSGANAHLVTDGIGAINEKSLL